jgi:hypothetical protein
MALTPKSWILEKKIDSFESFCAMLVPGEFRGHEANIFNLLGRMKAGIADGLLMVEVGTDPRRGLCGQKRRRP